MAETVNPTTGKQGDDAYGYVNLILDTQSDLYLLVGSKIVRVLFERRKPVEVKYV